MVQPFLPCRVSSPATLLIQHAVCHSLCTACPAQRSPVPCTCVIHREEGLRRQGFGDVYRGVKLQENVKAVGLLPDLLRSGPFPFSQTLQQGP